MKQSKCSNAVSVGRTVTPGPEKPKRIVRFVPEAGFGGSSLAGAVLFRGLGSGRKYIPGGDKHGRDHGADHETIETEDRDAPKRGNQHDVIR